MCPLIRGSSVSVARLRPKYWRSSCRLYSFNAPSGPATDLQTILLPSSRQIAATLMPASLQDKQASMPPSIPWSGPSGHGSLRLLKSALQLYSAYFSSGRRKASILDEHSTIRLNYIVAKGSGVLCVRQPADAEQDQHGKQNTGAAFCSGRFRPSWPILSQWSRSLDDSVLTARSGHLSSPER